MALADYAVWLDVRHLTVPSFAFRRAFPSNPSKHRHTESEHLLDKTNIRLVLALIHPHIPPHHTPCPCASFCARSRNSFHLQNSLNLNPTWLLEAQQAPAVGTTDLRNSSWCYWVCDLPLHLSDTSNMYSRRVCGWKGAFGLTRSLAVILMLI